MFKKAFTIFLILIFSLSTLSIVNAASLARVEYTLPNPGILPDNPIYFLKVVRDNVFVNFVGNDKEKSFYLLFLADKRLAAGEALLTKGNNVLGASTVNVAQEYFTKATDLAVKDKNVDLLQKISVSSLKHNDVISDWLTKIPAGTESEKLHLAFTANQKDHDRVMELLKIK